MKILVGYEGTPAGDAALTDLARSGLPGEGEATVYTVADLWPSAEEAPSPTLARAFPYAAQAHARAKKCMAQATRIARRGAARAHAVLPGWRVTAESVTDSPAWALFKKSRDMGADWVLVGCRPKAGMSRWGAGSVSQKVLTECAASVRIARPRMERAGPLRLLLAVDGSPGAELAVAEVCGRNWPAQTMVRVVAVSTDRLRGAFLRVPTLARWTKSAENAPNVWLGRMVESVERRLMEKGLIASGRVREGDPSRVLVDLASRWRADVIFLGARGLSPWRRFALGSVSTAVAGRAPCSVEVVRARRGT